ncbi:hypothetical protein [Sabulibacter ruber]|uniref:hypothetical protein n=1 Tax=Sabulibacter ruber TaxID=2811901 RepID=UPI001F617040|nr:hypothetical protein [Sabulibacter ruber]
MKHTLRFFSFLTVVFLAVLMAQPVAAQTEYLTPGQQKREVRHSVKEAKKMKTDFSESHLDVSAYNFKMGESGRKLKKRKKREQMPINEDGSAVVKPKLFSRKTALVKVKRN